MATQTRWRRMVAPSALGAAALAGAGYLYAVDPHQPGGYPLCPVNALTGFYCPGCGLLRASHYLLHGDLAGAFTRNPLVPLLAVFLAYVFVRWVVAAWRGTTLSWRPSPSFPRWLAVVVVAFTVARNIPGWEILSPA